jgi:hypothetical protein
MTEKIDLNELKAKLNQYIDLIPGSVTGIPTGTGDARYNNAFNDILYDKWAFDQNPNPERRVPILLLKAYNDLFSDLIRIIEFTKNSHDFHQAVNFKYPDIYSGDKYFKPWELDKLCPRKYKAGDCNHTDTYPTFS